MAVTKVVKIEADTKQATEEVKKFKEEVKDAGDEAKKTDKEVKSIAENGGAIATLDRLTGGLASTIRDAFEATKSFNFSLKATRGALIATGVGAFAVVLGAIVVYWEDIVELITGANAKLKEQEGQIRENLELLTQEEKILNATIDYYESQGKDIDNLLKKRKKLLDSQLLENQLLLANLLTRRAQEQEAADTLTLWEDLQQQFSLGFYDPNSDDVKRLKETDAEIAILTENILKIGAALNADDDEEDLDKKSEKEQNKIYNKYGFLSKFQLEQLVGDYKRAQEKIAQDAKVVSETAGAFFNFQQLGVLAGIDRVAKAREEDLKTQEEEAQKEQDILNARLSAQLAFASAVAGGIGALGQLFEEGTAARKGLALAEIGIGVATGIIQGLDIAQKSAAGTGPAAAFAYPIFAAQQLAAVLGAAAQARSVLESVPGPSVGGGFGGIGGGQSGGFNAPSFNIVEGSDTNQIVEGLNNQEPVQAFVVSSDVSSSQELDRNIVQSSRLG